MPGLFAFWCCITSSASCHLSRSLQQYHHRHSSIYTHTMVCIMGIWLVMPMPIAAACYNGLLGGNDSSCLHVRGTATGSFSDLVQNALSSVPCRCLGHAFAPSGLQQCLCMFVALRRCCMEGQLVRYIAMSCLCIYYAYTQTALYSKGLSVQLRPGRAAAVGTSGGGFD